MFWPLLVWPGASSTSAPYEMLLVPGLRSAELGAWSATCGQIAARDAQRAGKASAAPRPCTTGRTAPPCPETTKRLCPRPEPSRTAPARPSNVYRAVTLPGVSASADAGEDPATVAAATRSTPNQRDRMSEL